MIRCDCGGLIQDVPGRVGSVGPTTYPGGLTCERCFPEAMPDSHIFERNADKRRQWFGKDRREDETPDAYFARKGLN